MYKLIKILCNLSIIMGVLSLILISLFTISMLCILDDKLISTFGGLSLIGFIIFGILAIILDEICIKLENKVKK